MAELFNSFSNFLKTKFPNQKILKIPIAAGFSCPNRDGFLAKEGCIFCDAYASGPIRTGHWTIERQIENYMDLHPGRKYIAYFQSHSNTYGPCQELLRKCNIVFRYADIVGLSIGTRPDAISDSVFSLLEELKQRTYLTIELGLQSIHPRSLVFLNRNHTYLQFLAAFQKLKNLNIDTVIHLIIGIPGETRRHMLATINEMNRLKPQGIKFHLLHILKGTALNRLFQETPFPLLSQDEYCATLIYLLERLAPDIVIHRLSAEREKEIFIAPAWALNKQAVLNQIKLQMQTSGTFQGKKYKN